MRAHESRAPTRPTPTIPAPRSQDRPLAAGRRFDRHAGSNAEGARAPGNAFNAEIDAGIAEIGAAVAGTVEIAAEIGIAIATITVITAITTVTVNTRGIAARKD